MQTCISAKPCMLSVTAASGSKTITGAPHPTCMLSQLLFKPARNKTVETYRVVLAAEEGAGGPVNDLLLQL